jgi:hypothetical protein
VESSLLSEYFKMPYWRSQQYVCLIARKAISNRGTRRLLDPVDVICTLVTNLLARTLSELFVVAAEPLDDLDWMEELSAPLYPRVWVLQEEL